MKRVLTATTALVGMGFAASAAQAEEPISIGLSGFMNAYYAAGSDDDDLGFDRGVSSFQDATINFAGSTTLDNGLEVGTRFELESFGHPADEQYIYFKGSFGTLTLGGHNSSIYNLGWLASGHNYTAGAPINTGWIVTLTGGPGDSTSGFRSPAISTYVDVHNDDNTISYETPRFAGFKFGASYTPRTNGIGSTVGFNNGNIDANEHNGTSVAANFTRSFQDVTLAAAGGWARAEEGENFGNDEQVVWSGHANLAAAGFNFGGGFANKDADDTTDAATDGFSWDVGAGYTTGPWSFQVNYFKSEIEGGTGVGNGGDDENRFIQTAVDYAIGPGIKASATLMNARYEGNDAGDNTATATIGVLGTTVTF